MKLQNQAQPDVQDGTSDDQQPSIIEPYRGPLLERLREHEGNTQRMTGVDEPPTVIYEHEQPRVSTGRRVLIWLMVRLLTVREWIGQRWPGLMAGWRSNDEVLRQGRRGIHILLLVGLGEVIVSLIPWFNAIRAIPIIWLFFLVFGVFYSASAILYYHRSEQPRLALGLGILGHVLAVLFFLLPLLFH